MIGYTQFQSIYINIYNGYGFVAHYIINHIHTERRKLCPFHFFPYSWNLELDMQLNLQYYFRLSLQFQFWISWRLFFSCFWLIFQALKSAMKNCLETASQNRMVSLVFPPFGSGYLGYPVDVLSNSILDGVVDFERSNKSTSIKSVVVVCYRSQGEVFRVSFYTWNVSDFWYEVHCVKYSCTITHLHHNHTEYTSICSSDHC